jgi:transcriptional regulator with XRE-family HTH domain
MGRPPTGKPTSFDIAYLAGVSQPTVSRALRGDRSVSEATRLKIVKIAEDLRYTVDKNASSLRSQRSNTIALLFFEDDPSEEGMINPFFLAMLGSITRACARRGLDLLISFQRMEDNWHMRYQDAHRADGLILLGYGDYSLYSTRLAQLIEQGTHFARWAKAVAPRSDRTTWAPVGWQGSTWSGKAAAGSHSWATPARATPNSRIAMKACAWPCASRDWNPILACNTMPIPPRKTAIALRKR